MEYRSLSNDVRISRIGLGGSIFGHFCDAAATARVLAVAKENGINFVDTADVYSEGISEEYIGKVVYKQRSRWVIATKVGLRSHGKPDGYARAAKIRKRLHASLRRLKSEYVDIYQLHHFDPITPLEESLGALELLRREGKIRLLGVSNFSCNALSAAISIGVRADFSQVSSVQCHYNLLSRAAELGIFPLCDANDIAVLAYGVLARGILTGKYSSGDIPAYSRAATSESVRRDLTDEVLSAVHKLGLQAAGLRVRLEQLAVAWTLRRNSVASAIVGVRDENQLRTVAAAVQLRINQEQSAEIARIAQQVVGLHPTAFGSPVVYG